MEKILSDREAIRLVAKAIVKAGVQVLRELRREDAELPDKMRRYQLQFVGGCMDTPPPTPPIVYLRACGTLVKEYRL